MGNNRYSLILDRSVTDWLKILACIAVLFSHYVGFIVDQGISYSVLIQVLSHGGYWGVSVFFLLSGYGLMESQKRKALTINTFIKKRLLKVYLPAVLSAIIYVVILLILNKIRFTGGLLGCLWGWHDGILWFIKVLIVLYIVFFLYTQMDSRIPDNFSVILLVAITLVTFLVYYMTKPGYMYISIPTFFLGVFVSRFINIASGIFVNWVSSSLIILLLVVSLVFFRHNGLAVHALTDYIFIFALLAFLSHVSISIPSPNKYSTEMTYDVYLVHYKVLMMLGLAFNPIPFPLFFHLYGCVLINLVSF